MFEVITSNWRRPAYVFSFFALVFNLHALIGPQQTIPFIKDPKILKSNEDIVGLSSLFSIFSIVFGILLNLMAPIKQNLPEKRKNLCSTLSICAVLCTIFYASTWSHFKIGPGANSQIVTAWSSVFCYLVAFVCWMKSPLDVGLLSNRLVSQPVRMKQSEYTDDKLEMYQVGGLS